MATRKRSLLACTHCHRHKVRCDAYSLGLPCTRCQEDSTTCVLRQRTIRPRPPGHHLFKQSEPRYIQLTADTSGPMVRDQPSCESFLHYSKCRFVTIGEPSALDSADEALLTAKGCTQVPTYDLLEDFMKQYFIHIQPYAPLMDESMFWNIYEMKPDDGQPRHIHLLLLQAMLFASSPYVTKQTLGKCGFKDQRTAWSTLYQRAKLLYNCPIKVDPITRAQAALLLSLYTSSEEPQNGSLWLSHAIQSATQASPNPQERLQSLTQTVQESLYDRLWWSILLRDRILCLGLRRRPQVLSFEINMINSLPEEAGFEAEINGSRVYDPETRRTLFVAFRDLCQFSLLLAEMISLIYGHDCLTLPILTTPEFHRRLALVNSTQTLLGLWKTSSEMLTFDYGAAHDSILRFRHLTLLYYQAARINFAHYQTLLIKKHEEYVDEDLSPHIYRAGEILSDATMGIISTVEYFVINGKIQNPPLSLLGYLAMPLVLSAIDFKLAPTTSAMEDRRRTVEYIGEVISQLRRVYVIVDFISSELDKILQLAYYTSSRIFRQGSLPGQNASPWPVNPPAPIDNSRAPATTLNRNWHEAFLRHTGAYLWISTTVDYYFSVGRMPHLDIPSDFLSSVSPLNVIRLTYQPAPRQIGEDIILENLLESEVHASMDLSKQAVLTPHGREQAAGKVELGGDLVPVLDNDQIIVRTGPEPCEETEGYERENQCGKRTDLDFMSFED